MAQPTTITGRCYKSNPACRRGCITHKPLIRKLNTTKTPVGEDKTPKQISPYPSFGPLFSEFDSQEWASVKDRAWKHVLRSSKTDESETTSTYMEVIKMVESEARALYANHDLLCRLSSEQFIRMMIRDGCLQLQVTLCALGGWKQLGYPLDDPVFGEESDEQRVKESVVSMFRVGNQLPLIVLNELMRQSFFQKVLHSREWKRPMDLRRMALFDFLIVPAMVSRGGTECGCVRFSRNACEPSASDLLHGLWLLLTRPSSSNCDEDDCSDNEDDSALLGVPNAMELWRSSISFKDNGGMGTRGIRFNKNVLNAHLSLPSIYVDSHTEKLFNHLINYEIVQQLGPNRREVCAYLQLMRQLIRTEDDAKLLANCGIIRSHPVLQEQLLEILKRLHFPEVNNNRNLCLTRVQIRSYWRWTNHVMWERVRVIGAMLMLILVALQTVYVILNFYRKSDQNLSLILDVNDQCGVPLRVVKDALVHLKTEL